MIRLTVVTSDFGAAVHVGGGVEVKARTFDIPTELASYIESQLGECTSVVIAIEKEPTP
jgi:hypothetical protein